MALCACGCGKDAGVYATSSKGHKVGEPKKFLFSHGAGFYNRGRMHPKKPHCIRGHLRIPENLSDGGGCKLCQHWHDDKNKEKKIARIVAHEKANPKEHATKMRTWTRTETGRHSVLVTKLKQLYKLTEEQYESMFISQNNKCKICKVEFARKSHLPNSSHVDHDHSCCPGAKTCGKCIRGLLCTTCNLGLGAFKDDITALANAIQYLNTFKENQCQTQEKPTSYAQNQPEPILGAWVKPSYQELSFSQMETTA
jgi:hypothetical protein